MSSHLTVSYQSIPAVGANSAAGGKDNAAAGTPTDFLAAVLDFLASPAADTPTDAAPGDLAGLDPAVSGQLYSGFVASPDAILPATGDVAPLDPALIQILNEAVAQVDQALANGEAPGAELVKKLADAVEALAGLLAPQQDSLPLAADIGPTPAGQIDTLAIGLSTSLAFGVAPAPAEGAVADDLKSALALFASKIEVPGATPASAEGAVPVGPKSALALFVSKIEALGAALNREAPALATRLHALGEKLAAAAPAVAQHMPKGGAAVPPGLLAKLAAAVAKLEAVLPSVAPRDLATVAPPAPAESRSEMPVPAGVTLESDPLKALTEAVAQVSLALDDNGALDPARVSPPVDAPTILSPAPVLAATPFDPALVDTVTEVLTEVGQALADGTAPDANLLAALADVVDALDALSGLPQAPANIAAASIAPIGEKFVPAASAISPTAAARPGIPEIEVPALAVAAAPAASSQATGAADADSPVARLAQKLEALGVALADESPKLAARLDSLGERLASGEIRADVATKTGAPANPAPAAPSPATDAPGQRLQALLDASPTARNAILPPVAAAPDATDPRLKQSASVPPAILAPGLDVVAALAADAAGASRGGADTALKIALEAQAPATGADGAPKSALPVPGFAAALNAGPAAPDAPAANAAPAVDSAVQAAQSMQQSTQMTSTARLLQAAYQTPASQINLPQMAFEMVSQFQQGQSRFQIRLDPPELGRVDVRMHVDASGNVNARLTVERSETLDLFQRDQRSLERALAQAGLDSSKTNLEFSLRQNPFSQSGGNAQDRGSPFGNPGNSPGTASEDSLMAPVITLYRGAATAGGVNLFV